MPHDVLILEHPSTSPQTDWDEPIRCRELFACHRAAWPTSFPEELRSSRADLVVAHAVPGTQAALNFFGWLREHPLNVPTLAILPSDDIEFLRVATDAADDFLLSPVQRHELLYRLARLLGPAPRNRPGEYASLASELGLKQMVGQDPEFLRTVTQAALFSSSDAPVLLTGETGTGKELCAHLIHLLGKRHAGPFIPVECGGLPDHLFENELFGHARGAFTDAHSDQKGLVALASGGTLFLDEIDGLSVSAQGKLLRLLQENTFRPLGSGHFNRANVRVIAATNSSLEKLMEARHFRADLFFRLNVLRIHLPALRERPSDILLLAKHFADEISATTGIPRKVLSPASLRRLQGYHWPGNVRELYNVLHRAVLSAPGLQVTAAHLELSTSTEREGSQSSEFRASRALAIETFERNYIQRLLEKHGGNITHAAREAGKDRRVFGRLAKKYRLNC